MDYQKHYNLLVTRQRNLPPDTKVEVHHILPTCMGGEDTPDNLVPLTLREHYLAHVLLAKITNDVKLWEAVRRMGGYRGRQSSRIYESAKKKAHPFIVAGARKGGKIGGLLTGKFVGKKIVELRLGIHSLSSEERKVNAAKGGRTTGALHAKNKTGVCGRTPEQTRIDSRKGGQASAISQRENGTGVYTLSKEHHSRCGATTKEKGVGIFGMSEEDKRVRNVKGGKSGGVITSTKRMRCDICGLVSTPGALGVHQSKLGHVGKSLLKEY